MPNTPAIVQAGATAIAARRARPRGRLRMSRELFEAVGRVVVLEEALLDAVTGLSGSGPAYVMVIIEALADGGVKAGLHARHGAASCGSDGLRVGEASSRDRRAPGSA